MSVIRFKDEDDVVAMANDSVYGLASGVFSRDITRALRTGHRLEAGTVWVNSCASRVIFASTLMIRVLNFHRST